MQELIKPIEEQKKENVCNSCGQELQEDRKIFSDEQEVWVCETCYDEDEPCLTIVTNDPSSVEHEPDENGFYKAYVKHYSNDTGGEFKAKYVRTDGWRGYYDVIASKSWVKFHSDCILAYSGDAEELEDFDEKLEEYLNKSGVRFAKVFSRTSNLFSTGYDFFVRRKDFKTAKQVEKTAKIVESLKQKYRDDERFTMTALTGTSKKTKEGKMLVQASKMLEQGMDAESVFNAMRGCN